MDDVDSREFYASSVGPMTFRKTDHHSNAIDYEVAGLTWLRAAQPKGAQIVEVLDHGQGWLTEPDLASVRPTPQAAEEFGRRLAHTHAAGASHLGAAPDGFAPDGGYIGRAPLPLPSEPSSSWGEFYGRYRIEPYMDSLDANARAITSRLVDRLASGDLDHDQPALVTDAAARTHGDMWTGNLMWTADGVVRIALPLKEATPKRTSQPYQYSALPLPSGSGKPTTKNLHWPTAGATELGCTSCTCSWFTAGSSAADTSIELSRSLGGGFDPVLPPLSAPRGPTTSEPEQPPRFHVVGT